MTASARPRADRAWSGIDRKALARLTGVPLPTIRRMAASNGNVRGIADIAPGQGTGLGVRLETSPSP